jgi:glyoxylase-like metal-dependent hydrolase (beta-lactamase superfamily II)
MSHLIRRRDVLLGAGTLAICGASQVRAQHAAIHRIGDAILSVFSDGGMGVPPDRFVDKAFGGDGAAMLRRIGAANGGTFAINVCVLDLGGKRYLIDSGAGPYWIDTAGKLPDVMDAAGITPESIDHVIITHCHADHLWGVVDEFDSGLRYPRATYFVPAVEFDFWSGDKALNTQGVHEGVAAGAKRVLKLIGGKTTRVAAGAEILPGIATIDAGGHCPGQCGIHIKSAGQSLVITADTLFHPIVSVEHPDWQPLQDMDGPRAGASRRRILDIAANEKALVAAYHIATPGLGRIERAGNGYKWRNAI